MPAQKIEVTDSKDVLRIVAIILLLAGCIARQPTTLKDPFEPVNQSVFGLNDTLDRHLIQPAVDIYKGGVSEDLQNTISNFVQNWSDPAAALNYILRGDRTRAEATVARFIINTTSGILGLFDTAEGIGCLTRPLS